MNKQRSGGIGYCDFTWSPVTGCYGPNGQVCGYCFARRIAERFRDQTGKAAVRMVASADDRPLAIAECRVPFPAGFTPTFYHHRLREPQDLRKAATIFACDTADLFGPWVPATWIECILDVIRKTPWHTYLLLTKNPARYAEFAWPENCWLGTTVTNQVDADERIPILSRTRAWNYWVSVEPMLGPVNLRLNPAECVWLDRVVCGGQTGPGSPPVNPDWVRAVRDQCTAAKADFYFKSWGEWRPWRGLEDDECPCGDKYVHDVGYPKCTRVHFWGYTGTGDRASGPRGVSLSVRVGRKRAGRWPGWPGEGKWVDLSKGEGQ